MFITFPPVHRKTAAFLNLFVFRERLTGDSACLIPVPAAPPQSWCPSSSSPPPGRNHRGDWRSPTPKKAPAQRRRTPGCGTYPPGRRLKDALLVFLRDAAAGVGNANQKLFRLLRNRNLHRAARTVVLDCIFRQVKKQSVNQCITADEEAVSLHLQRNIALFCQKREICEDLLNHRAS